MAKIIKPESHHAFTMQSDNTYSHEMSLVKGGRRCAYIWTPSGTYSGPETLRKFAKAILKEIPARKAKP